MAICSVSVGRRMAVARGRPVQRLQAPCKACDKAQPYLTYGVCRPGAPQAQLAPCLRSHHTSDSFAVSESSDAPPKTTIAPPHVAAL